MRYRKLRNHAAALGSEIKPEIALGYVNLKLSPFQNQLFLLSLYSNHKVKHCLTVSTHCFPGSKASRHGAVIPQGWSIESPAAMSRSNKLTFLSLIWFLFGRTQSFFFFFFYSSVTGATGDRLHLIQYVFALKGETAVTPAASQMRLCPE